MFRDLRKQKSRLSPDAIYLFAVFVWSVSEIGMALSERPLTACETHTSAPLRGRRMRARRFRAHTPQNGSPPTLDIWGHKADIPPCAANMSSDFIMDQSQAVEASIAD
jgi:hypothetical protein